MWKSLTRIAAICFDKLPDMRKYTQAQQITKLRQQSDACVTLGSETATNAKYVLAYLVELQNRLESKVMNEPSLGVKLTATEHSINRHANYMGVNLSHKRGTKRKKSVKY